MGAWRRALHRLPEGSVLKESPFLANLGMIVLIVAMAAWSYYLIEKPFLTSRQVARVA